MKIEAKFFLLLTIMFLFLSAFVDSNNWQFGFMTGLSAAGLMIYE